MTPQHIDALKLDHAYLCRDLRPQSNWQANVLPLLAIILAKLNAELEAKKCQ